MPVCDFEFQTPGTLVHLFEGEFPVYADHQIVGVARLGGAVYDQDGWVRNP